MNVGDRLFEGVGVDEDVVKVNNAEKVEIIVEAIVGISLLEAGALVRLKGMTRYSKCP